jgi:CRISPR-associated protein Csh1
MLSAIREIGYKISTPGNTTNRQEADNSQNIILFISLFISLKIPYENIETADGCELDYDDCNLPNNINITCNTLKNETFTDTDKTNLESKNFEIEMEDYNVQKKELYLQDIINTKGNQSSPFAQLTEADKTFDKKIKAWFSSQYTTNKQKSKQQNNYFISIGLLLNKYGRMIKDKINEKNSTINKKNKKIFLSVKINNKYLGEFKIIRDRAEELLKKKFEASSSNDKEVCAVCGEFAASVSGKTNVYRFYTIDKPGFITSGFREKEAWRNFPVCSDCVSYLGKGKEYLELNLRFNFCGIYYYLIPQLVIDKNNIMPEIYDILLDSPKLINLKKKEKRNITGNNDDILDILKDGKNYLTLNFLFLEKNKSAEKILLLIEDVFPSRIKKIFEAKDYVDFIFKRYQQVQNEDAYQASYEYSYNFGELRKFYLKSDNKKRNNNDLDKYFLDIVNSVFKNTRIDFLFIMKFFINNIRENFINETENERYFNKFNKSVTSALMNILFFEKLDLLDRSVLSEENMNNNNCDDERDGFFNGFFERYGNTFESYKKRGIFLVGTLTQLLLDVQYEQRNKSRPFMKKLRGLKMDYSYIKALLPDVQNKLDEYGILDEYGYKGLVRQILSDASLYLLKGESADKNISADEANFYFACGMNLYKNIKTYYFQQKLDNKET